MDKKGCIEDCTCPKTECERHSKCCECVANHKTKDYLPFCLRPPKPEEDEK